MNHTIPGLRHLTPRRRRARQPQAEGLEVRQLLTAGTLDTSFNTTGCALEGPAYAYAVQIDSLGKILAAGDTGGTTSDFRVVRTLPSGTPDPSFGSNGSVTTDFAGETDSAKAMAVLADGRIAVAGTAGNVYSVTAKGKTTKYLNNDFGLVLYQPDGSPATAVKVTTNISTYTTLGQDYEADKAWGMAVQGDGKIVVGGQSWTGSGTTEAALVRYLSSGARDPNFGPNGNGIVHIQTPSTFQSDGVSHVEIQRDPTNPDNDKIVTMEAPSALDSSGNRHWSVAVGRYNLDGTPDTTFGTNGRTITTMAGQIDAWSMALGRTSSGLIDGSIVVGGFYFYPNGTTPPDLALFRYTATGILDTSFGLNHDGVVLFDAGASPGTSDQGYSVAIQPNDGRILLAGGSSTSSLASSASAIVARFQTTGAIDTTFGTNGVARNMFTNSDNSYSGLAVQPADGKIVAVGYARTQVNSKTSKYDILIVRYQGDPVAPPSTANAVIGGATSIGPSEMLVPWTDPDLTQLATEWLRSTPKRSRPAL